MKITSLDLIYQGKVRDLYDIDDRHMLMVASDRLSAFDVILPTPIPGKGRILTQISKFWFDRTQSIVPNHLELAELDLVQVLLDPIELNQFKDRAVVVKRLKGLPVEAIVRGYLIGSGWRDYEQTGSVSGIQLPEGLEIADQLPEPIFTPSTKAPIGSHDENISFDQAVEIIGSDLAEAVRSISLQLYKYAANYALDREIIIADSKFEFGLDEFGSLVLMDELLTPDSSRFWPVDQYEPGINPPSYDKQFVRDYLETLNWDKQPPGPSLPLNIVDLTMSRYHQALVQLTN